MQHNIKGFTMLELMVVIILIAILAAIAIPSYQHFARKSDEAAAQQQIQRIAADLELFKSRQFNYAGYSLDTALGHYPNAVTPKYTFNVYDGTVTSKALNDSSVTGRSWVITAQASSTFPKLPNYIMTSTGKYCTQPQGETLKLDCQGAAAWSK